MSPMGSREIEGEPQTGIIGRAWIDTYKKVLERHTLLRQIYAILLGKTIRAIVTFRKDSADSRLSGGPLGQYPAQLSLQDLAVIVQRLTVSRVIRRYARK